MVSSNPFLVRLDQFEGPLDLLLHLIKVNEIDVFAVDLLFLADQYFAYLRLVEFRDLAEAGDFLRIAATLLEIKSRRLLPGEEKGSFDELLTDDDDAQQLEFKQRLFVYACIKQATQFLQNRYLREAVYCNEEWQRLLANDENFTRPLPPRGDKWVLPVLYSQLLTDLVARNDIIPKAKIQKIKIETIMTEVLVVVERQGLVALTDFFGRIPNRSVLVVYFIAILELAKSGEMHLHQQQEMIWLYHQQGTLP